MVVLFYEEGLNEFHHPNDYGKGVANFLEAYYFGHDIALKSELSIEALSKLEETQIRGRCGYIRQGFPVALRDLNYDKILLHIEGVNGKLTDIDYLTAALTTVQRHSGVPKEVSGTPAWFR